MFRPRRRLFAVAVLLALCLPGTARAAGGAFISEFLSSNTTSIADADGASSDWIELSNGGDAAVDLADWCLTDDAQNLTKWRFPAIDLDPGAFLLVFASGKNRAVAGAELHTNFQLDGDGEYLALVEPDGRTIAHEFAPRFPRQRGNVSYGATMEVTTLLADGAAARVYIPTDGALGLAWTAPAFQPGGLWTPAIPTGIGFQVATEPTVPDALAWWNLDGDLLDAIGSRDGTFVGGAAPTFTAGFDGTPNGAIALDGVNDHVSIPQGGGGFPIYNRPAYTVSLWVKGLPQPDYRVFCEGSTQSNTPLFTIGTQSGGTAGTVDIYLRDGANLQILNHVNSQRVAFDGTWHHIAWVDQNGAAALYIDGVRDAANFNYTKTSLSLNTTAIGCVLRAAASHWFKGAIDGVAVWDRALTADEVAELATGVAPGGQAFKDLIRSDVEALMRGVNASAYVRIPFSVADPRSFASLTLLVKYDDGFAAYLNGREVARRNAPASLSWNSSAVDERPRADAVAYESINLSHALDALVAGQNVLAIHALNRAASDDEFLILPVLTAAGSPQGNYEYFTAPTPGAPNGDGYPGFVADTVFSRQRGFYDAPFPVSITTATAGATIRYTTNGSPPTPTSGTLYTGQITIDGTTTLRAAAFKDGLLPTNVDTHTYIFTSEVIRQTGAGFPTNWGDHPLVYAMVPAVVNDPAYRDTIDADLKSLPVLSIVMPIDDVFGGTRGIYPNATQRWEWPGSVEFFQPDGSRGFHIDCGVAIHGGSSRNWTSTPKHSFAIFFRGEYGPTRLRFPLFKGSPVTEFDSLVLRACYTDTWCCRYMEPRYRPDTAQFLRDQWMRDAQIAMGSLSARGVAVSLYVDGLYWGLYNMTERPESDFFAYHRGGEPEEYDVYKDLALTNGSSAAWDTMFAMANAGLSSDLGYQRIQEYLDVEKLIDYMILHLWGGAEDWPHHNWAAARRRVDGAGFTFHVWDQEIVLDVIDRDYSEKDYDKSPARLHQRLRANPEYRLRFADRVHRHLFNDGVLTPAGAAGLYRRWTDTIDRAVVGESARWGDYRVKFYDLPRGPFTRDDDWVAQRDWLFSQYFPQRTTVMIEQFRADGLYPSVRAPVFNQHGGTIEPGFRVLMANPNGAGTMYYTVDGSDPREYGTGAVAGTAAVYAGPIALPGTTRVRARVRSAALEWSACADALFSVPLPLEALRFTEIMYHPVAADPAASDLYEFVELRNTGGAFLDMTGVALAAGISFVFPEGFLLGPGKHAVVAADLGSFAERYPGIPAAGAFGRSLSNDGDTVELRAPDGTFITSVTFADRAPWPAAADGLGSSLVPIDPQGLADPDDYASWRASSRIGGSPGSDDPEPLPGGGQIPGDLNQDAGLNVADPIALLRYLFGGDIAALPCQGTPAQGGGNLALIDVNGDARADISDAISMLRYIFGSGPAPRRGTQCVPMEGCPEVCGP